MSVDVVVIIVVIVIIYDDDVVVHPAAVVVYVFIVATAPIALVFSLFVYCYHFSPPKKCNFNASFSAMCTK